LRAIKVSSFGKFRAGFAGLQQQIGGSTTISHSRHWPAAISSLDAQRLVFRILRMPRFEIGAHFLGVRQCLQHALQIERLGRGKS